MRLFDEYYRQVIADAQATATHHHKRARKEKKKRKHEKTDSPQVNRNFYDKFKY